MIDLKNYVEDFLVAGDQNERGYGKQAALYLKLITEELIHETIKEYDMNNIIGIADGIADSIWVIEGFRITLNINKESVWNDVNRKIRDHNDIKNNTIIYDLLLNYSYLRKEYNCFAEHSPRYTYSEKYMQEYIVEVLTNLLLLSKNFNIPMQEVYDEVARSNFSKVSDSGKMIKNEHGKIQKPPTYSPPNIKAILDRS